LPNKSGPAERANTRNRPGGLIVSRAAAREHAPDSPADLRSIFQKKKADLYGDGARDDHTRQHHEISAIPRRTTEERRHPGEVRVVVSAERMRRR
jgi:hypothetical protein